MVGKWEHRKALLRNLLVALFLHERIKTTEAKAKELRRLADKMITLAKKGDLAARRQALSILPDKAVVRKLFSEIKDRYAYRQSGFTRIVRIGPRRGDAAMMVFIELVTDKLEHKPSPQKRRVEEEAKVQAPVKEATSEETLQEEQEKKELSPEAKTTEAEESKASEGAVEASAEKETPEAGSESEEVRASTEEKTEGEKEASSAEEASSKPEKPAE